MLHDNETKTDLLAYAPIARTITALLVEPPYSPMTIGVHGDWGAGKSSVLEMVADTMEAHKGFLTLKVNGWRYQGFEDAKISLIETIVDELLEKRPALRGLRETVAAIWKRINWLKVAKHAATGAAILLSKGAYLPVVAAKKIGDELKPGDNEKWLTEAANAPEEIREFRKAFDQLLDAAEVTRLIVLIDDLDRCLPATTIETLEAVRLFLFTPKTAFVIAADEAMVEYSVKQHFPNLAESTSGAHFARNYLEKLIQVPFRLPSLGRNETHLYTSLLLIENAVGPDHDLFKKAAELAREQLKQPWKARSLKASDFGALQVPVEVNTALALADQISSVLADGTQGNPRQVKRFIVTLLLRHRTAVARGFGGAIQLTALAKLMLAERYQSRVFEQVERVVASSASGHCHQLEKLEDIVETGPGPGDIKEPPGDDLVSQWFANEDVTNWAKVLPKLGPLDLRPYLFVTRDRKRAAGGVTALGDLEALVSKLLGPRMAVSGQRSEIKKLSPQEVDRLFEAVKARVQLADQLAESPPGIHGLILLASIKPDLAPQALDVLEGLPEEELGMWAATGWGTIFDAHQQRFEKLLVRWSRCEANKKLADAAKAALKMKTMKPGKSERK